MFDRYALNFKGIYYQTEWVELTEVESVRKKLGAEPVRAHRDGSSFYTLPVIKDHSTGEIVGDSFQIALYLEKTYTNAPPLFPGSTFGLYAAFNAQVDATFNPFVILMAHGIPFNPETAETSKATFCWRAGRADWDELTVRGEERAQKLEGLKAALGELAKFYSYGDGPFMQGENASYADCIVGGWLAFMKVTLKEWEEVKTWHDGLWGKLHLALEEIC